MMLKRILDFVVMLAAWIAVIATIMMMLQVTADIIGREVFNAPITGTIEIASAYNMAALSFLPLALIARERGHILVELFTGWMKPTGRSLLDGFVGIVTVLYTGAFAWKAFEVAIEKTHLREAKEAGIGFVEIWPARWLVAIGFGLMACYVLVNMLQDFKTGLSKSSDKTDTSNKGDTK